MSKIASIGHRLRRKAEVSDAKGLVLGLEYTDSVTGIKGVAIACYLYLTGCDQICLNFVKEGESKYLTIDASRLVELAAPKRKERAKVIRAGGPADSPPSRSVGARH